MSDPHQELDGRDQKADQGGHAHSADHRLAIGPEVMQARSSSRKLLIGPAHGGGPPGKEPLAADLLRIWDPTRNCKLKQVGGLPVSGWFHAARRWA